MKDTKTSTVSNKSNKTSTSIKAESLVSVNKHNKGSQLNNVDVVAVHEWVEQKDGVSFLSSLRAIALLCSLVEGLDDLFFSLAREIPDKIDFKDGKMESIVESLSNVNKDILEPFDYIKSLQNIFAQSTYSKELLSQFDENFLIDELSELNTRFSLVTKEEYELLKSGKMTVTNKDGEVDYLAYANNLEVSRRILKGSGK